MIDIDAVLSETKDRILKYRGTEFVLPGELPGAALAPFLDKDLNLMPLVTGVINSLDGEDSGYNIVELLSDSLTAQPNLPLDILTAANASFRALLGEEQHDQFANLNPSVPAYLLIARSLLVEYGVSLADFFVSSGSSETDGEPSSATSSESTESTPDDSGTTKAPARSRAKKASESDAS